MQKVGNFMTNFMLVVLLNVTVSFLCVFTFLVNYAVLKLKTEYKGFKWQIFLALLAPGFNFIFLLFNLLLITSRSSGYKVIKIKQKKTRTVKA